MFDIACFVYRYDDPGNARVWDFKGSDWIYDVSF